MIKQLRKEILAEVKKEGGALGMKNLKGIADDAQLNKVVNSMLKRKVLFKHKNGGKKSLHAQPRKVKYGLARNSQEEA